MFQVIYTFITKFNCINSDHLPSVGLGWALSCSCYGITRTRLSWPEPAEVNKITKDHFSPFHVSGEESVGFSQNSGDITVLLKKKLCGIIYMYTYVSFYSIGATCTCA